MVRIVYDERVGEAWWCEELRAAETQPDARAVVRCLGRRREVEVRLPPAWEQRPDEHLARLIRQGLADGEVGSRGDSRADAG